MGSVVTYKNDGDKCFCQIKFESGERVLISIAGRPQPSIKVMRLTFAGMFPRNTVWELDSKKLDNPDQLAKIIVKMFFPGKQLIHPLDAIRDALLPCHSIQEAVAVLKEKELKARGLPIPERLVSKQDADRIFGLNRGQWEAEAKQMVHPLGWKVRLAPVETGTSVTSIDPKTGMAFSVQPLWTDAQGPPRTLVVGNYYPGGTFSELSDQLKGEMEADARSELGPEYDVSVVFSRIKSSPSGLDVVEIIITR